MATPVPKARKAAKEASDGFLKRVKVDIRDRKVADARKVLASEVYDAAGYAARLALAGKAQRILNRIALAQREGRLSPTDRDIEKVRAIAGEALSDWKARLMMRNMLATSFYAGIYEEGMGNRTKLYAFYETMADSRVRPLHRRWHRLLLPKSHRLVRQIMPPNGHNCRCRMTFKSAAEAARLIRDGATTRAPKVQVQEYIDRATGERLKTIEGVDPGWLGEPSVKAEKVAKLFERSLRLLEKEVEAV